MTRPPSVYDRQTTLPFVSSSTTSMEAAQSVEDGVPTDLHRVFMAILGAPIGLTDEEAQDCLKMNPSTERPRRVHLVQMGVVADAGITRKTRSGRAATVWRATGKPCPSTERRSKL